MTRGRARIVVCGTRFGHLWIDSISKQPEEFEVVAVVARGSDRSKAICAKYRIPMVQSVAAVEGQVDAAVVAIGGKSGEDVTREWMQRGVPVLLEHPVEPSFLSRMGSRRSQIPSIEVNGHFKDLPTVQRFTELCSKKTSLLQQFSVAFVATQRTLYSCLDIVVALLPAEDISRLVEDKSWRKQSPEGGLQLGPLRLLATVMPLTSTVDDAAGSIGAHLIEVWLPDKRIILAGPTGPIISLGAGGPMSSTWALSDVGVAATWREYATHLRPAALVQALRRLLTPRSPRERLQVLQRDRLVAMVWRRLLDGR